MILTDMECEKAYEGLLRQTLRPQDKKTVLQFARAIESAVLEKLKAQKPFAFTNSAQLGYVKDGMHPDIPLAMWSTNTTYSGANIKLYTNPLPPDDVVRDAERYKWLRKIAPNIFWDNHDKEIGFVRFDTKAYLWKPEMFDAAIDAAMKEMK